jgi:hypothetical protein
MMNGKNTYLAIRAIYVEYDVISKNGRPHIIAPHILIKLPF